MKRVPHCAFYAGEPRCKEKHIRNFEKFRWLKSERTYMYPSVGAIQLKTKIWSEHCERQKNRHDKKKESKAAPDSVRHGYAEDKGEESHAEPQDYLSQRDIRKFRTPLGCE